MTARRIWTDWAAIDRQRERIEAHRAAERETARRVVPSFHREIAAVWTRNAERHVTSGMPDRDVCELADRRCDVMRERIGAVTDPHTPESMRAWLDSEVRALDARGLPEFSPGLPLADQLAGIVRRVQCPRWWRRQLRRAVVTLRETEAMHAGEVCKRRRQVYVTDDTVARRAERNVANAAMLEATEIESRDGECITLAQAVAASTANKAIRRGELMTRIRGCEEWADAAGMVGMFTTNTAPSRFHSQTMHRGANPKHDGSTPRDAQQWLCGTWAKTRAALQRAKVRFFGFRVAEPHHDGCPHWHMLLWVDAAQLAALRDTMRRYWLADDGDEAGAAEHRFKAVEIDKAKGGAIAYVSKYIAKNIDDVGAIEAQGHTDERAGEQGELFGATARRVEAWAAAWGIRQFQALGQPPVTVWRELRRIDAQAVAGASDAIKAAHAAVNRDGLRRACWRSYMAAQGGAMTGRAYRVRIAADIENREGRYGVAEVTLPRGVEDTLRPGEWVLSSRREWKPRGLWSEGERQRDNPLRQVVRGSAPQAPCPPRTRVNNCTDWRPMRALLRALNESRAPREPWAGGSETERYSP